MKNLKKVFLLTISILMVTVVFAKGSNPIPSYNVQVTKQASFSENNGAPSTIDPKPSDERRDMNVSNDASGGGNRPAQSILIVYIFRLDQSIVLGPYMVGEGETLTIGIDGSPWGVVAETNHPTTMSVWTNSVE